jgi:pSer/pThr/pTyr-binding forkhead associated (FHA) protein
MKGPQTKNDETQVKQPTQQIHERLKASVVIVEGQSEGMEYPITKSHTVIGRDKNADFPVNDSLVSRQHVCIVYQEGIYILRDLESTNGTHMDGTSINQANLLHGDKFRIGDTTLQFIFDDTGHDKVYEIK